MSDWRVEYPDKQRSLRIGASTEQNPEYAQESYTRIDMKNCPFPFRAFLVLRLYSDAGPSEPSGALAHA